MPPAPKELGSRLEDAALRCQFIERWAGLVGGIQLKNGIRPKGTTLKLIFDEGVYAFVVDADEALDVVPIVGDNFLTQRKNIHGLSHLVKHSTQYRIAL